VRNVPGGLAVPPSSNIEGEVAVGEHCNAQAESHATKVSHHTNHFTASQKVLPATHTPAPVYVPVRTCCGASKAMVSTRGAERATTRQYITLLGWDVLMCAVSLSAYMIDDHGHT
jgi:hypothetical protein